MPEAEAQIRGKEGGKDLAKNKNKRLKLKGNNWTSLVAQLVNKLLQCRRSRFDSWVRKIPCRRDRLPTPVFLDFPGGSDGKESACTAEA